MLISPAAQLIDRIYATGQVEAGDGTLHDAFPSGMPREHTEKIAALVSEHSLTRTLEVGLGFGLSALTICAVHEERGDGDHIAIDPGQHRMFDGIGLLNVERAGLAHRLRFLERRSENALPQLLDEDVRLDFAVIDGRHIFDTALVDFYFCDLMLDVGGLLMLHDTWVPSQAQVLTYIRRNRAYELLSTGDGTIAILRKRGDDDRLWFEHRGFAFDWLTWRSIIRLQVGKRLGFVRWPPPARRPLR